MDKVKNIKRELLPKQVWNMITETYFGDWETYRSFKGKKFPEGYSTALAFARTHSINTIELASAFCACILPFKKKEEELVYGIVKVGELLVPTTNTNTDTKKVKKPKTNPPKRVAKTILSDRERIQNHLAQAVWKVRDANFKFAVSDTTKFETLAKQAHKTWEAKFLELNSNSNAAKDMLKKLHYPKAVMSYWVKRNSILKKGGG